jgi:hypothetical protein
VVDAVRCAIEVQSDMVERNAGVAPDKRIEFRVGIHLGDVAEEADGDLMGDGVNIAARLDGICKPGGVCLSGAAYEQVRDRVRETFIDLGEKALKNIGRPVRAYDVTLDRPAAQAGPGVREKTPRLALPDKPAIGVVPLTNMSGDPEQSSFPTVLARTSITTLSKLRWSFVIARNTSFTYKGKAVHMKQVPRNSASATFSRAAFGKAAIASASRRSSTTRRPEVISGRSATTATLRTCSRCKKRSLRRSWPRSSRSSMPRKIFAPNANLRIALTPGTSLCGHSRTTGW